MEAKRKPSRDKQGPRGDICDILIHKRINQIKKRMESRRGGHALSLNVENPNIAVLVAGDDGLVLVTPDGAQNLALALDLKQRRRVLFFYHGNEERE